MVPTEKTTTELTMNHFTEEQEQQLTQCGWTKHTNQETTHWEKSQNNGRFIITTRDIGGRVWFIYDFDCPGLFEDYYPTKTFTKAEALLKFIEKE